LAARSLAYHEPVEGSGPVIDTATADNGKIVLTFKHLGGGLVSRGDLTGFTIAGHDHKYLPATATIAGDTVVLSNEQIAHPESARYAWENVPTATLYNRAGLPASPFQTDVTGKNEK
jgi:sialate O-acetylesterase